MTRKNLILTLTCLTIFLFTSCDKENRVKLSKSDYIIFGHFYGECAGEGCVEIFRLEQDKLFEDTKDEYPTREKCYDGNYVELSEQKFNDIKDLVNSFPKDLLNEPNVVIG
jgi:hypothetical protein